jgi:hypothetical protein
MGCESLMPGRPVSRARKEAAAAGTLDQQIEAAPLSLRCRERPEGWRKWPIGQRFDHLFGCTFDNAEIVLSWDPLILNAHQLSVWKEINRAILNLGGKFALSRARDQSSQAAAAELHRRLDARQQQEPLADQHTTSGVLPAETPLQPRDISKDVTISTAPDVA